MLKPLKITISWPNLCKKGHTRNKKNIFFSEIRKPDHKLSKKFYFNKISYFLAELWMFFYFMFFFFAKVSFSPIAPVGRNPLACLPGCLLSAKKFSVWVNWNMFCCFWPIKLCDLSQVVLIAPIFLGIFFYHSCYGMALRF